MTPIQSASAAAILGLALSTAFVTSGGAGEVSVSPDATVFIPPSVFIPPPPTLPQTTTPPQTTTGARADDTGAEKTEATGSAAQEAENQVTQSAVSSFEVSRFICSAVPDAAYQIDCLADQLEQLAENLPKTADFAEARQTVQAAADRLEQVARRNVSSTKRPARLRQDTTDQPRRSSRPIVPVAPDRLEAANALATTVLREAETILLRAAEQSERRKMAFTQVAQAVGSSSTILLRSR